MFHNPSPEKLVFIEAAKNIDKLQEVLDFAPHYLALSPEEKFAIYFEAYEGACERNNLPAVQLLLNSPDFKIEECSTMLLNGLAFAFKGNAIEVMDYLMCEHPWEKLQDKKTKFCADIFHDLCTDPQPFSLHTLHHLIDNYLAVPQGRNHFIDTQIYDDFCYAWHYESYEILYLMIEKFQFTGLEERFKNAFFGLMQGGAVEDKIFELFAINQSKKELEAQLPLMDEKQNGYQPQLIDMALNHSTAPPVDGSSSSIGKKSRKI